MILIANAQSFYQMKPQQGPDPQLQQLQGRQE